MIYLDYAANTPPDVRVLEAFVEAERAFPGNPNSLHPEGRRAKAAQESALAAMAALLGVKPTELIPTSGASEANNLAIIGAARMRRHMGRHIISTPLEHASVSAALTWLQEEGWDIDLLPLTREGKVDLSALAGLMRDDTVLVSVTAVDSELGTIQPIQDVAAIVHRHPRCLLHVDGTQAVGKIPVPLDGIDLFSLSAHKIYGLNGSGLLVKKEGIQLEPIIHGGASTTIWRSGTPTLALDVALAKALELEIGAMDAHAEAVAEKKAYLLEHLAAYPEVTINSPADSLPYLLDLSVRGIKGTEFQAALAARDVCVSVKSACSAPGLPSRSVFAVSHDRRRALQSWRISLSHLTTRDDLDGFLEAFDAIIKEHAHV